MKFSSYPKYFMPENAWGHCSLMCCMGVMNYFWNTWFNWQNIWEMMNLMKAGKYTGKEMLDLPEIAYRLHLLWFTITYFVSMSEERYVRHLNDPLSSIFKITDPKYHHFIDEKWIRHVPVSDHWIDTKNVTYENKIMNEQNIEKVYSANIIENIKQNQREGVLFIVWVSYYVLHDEEPVEWDPWWHVIIVTEVINDKVIIYDPGAPVLHHHEVDIERFVNAVQDMWEYSFIKITYNEEG